jgi:tetratricopeptide (TPR) repeat protein
MSADIIRCIEPQIYSSSGSDAAASFEERRAILLARLSEGELTPTLQSALQEHLSHCTACSEFVKDLNDDAKGMGDLDRRIIEASCPSSLNLDRFVTSRQQLVPAEQQRIEIHLQQCPLCEEEAEWIKKMESRAVVSFVSNNKKTIQYASIAAALFFMALSIFLFYDRMAVRNTESRLRAAAVIKQPDQIDYFALQGSSSLLPEKMTGIYEQGVEALKQQRFEEAIRHLELVARAHPEHSGAVFLLGYSYYQMNEPQRAFELCDRAEKMLPHSLERCLSLVNIALKTGHYRRALEEISGLHHAAPDHPEIKQTYERITAISRGRILRL